MNSFYTSNRVWTRILVGALAIYEFVVILATCSNAAQIFLLTWIAKGGKLSQDRAVLADGVAGYLNTIHIWLFLLTALAFLIWFPRAHKNLPVLGAVALEHSPGWAVGAFFVPIVNLYRPMQIMREIWKASDPATPADTPYAWAEQPSSPLIGWWWGLWIARSFLGSISSSLMRSATSVESYLVSIGWSMGSQMATLAATVLLILLVLRIGQRQDQRAAMVGRTKAG
ncbi:MAG TPA: DUF4328 domain-containing protein [Symbiobacteriaceae bacterium]|nr:DUF4328 domain-containing protein [Symbiobacteriaceae bacterium]